MTLNLNPFTLSALLACLISACTPYGSPYSATNNRQLTVNAHQDVCPAGLPAYAQQLMRQLAMVTLGDTKSVVMTKLGSPREVESYMLNDGRRLEVFFYQTNHPKCPQAQMPTPVAEMPFVFSQGRLMGYGADYYEHFVVPSLQRSLPMAQPAF